MAVGASRCAPLPSHFGYRTGTRRGVGSARCQGAKVSVRTKSLRVGLWSVRRATGVADESLAGMAFPSQVVGEVRRSQGLVLSHVQHKHLFKKQQIN